MKVLKIKLLVIGIAVILMSCKDNANDTDKLKDNEDQKTEQKASSKEKTDRLEIPTVNIQENDKLVSPAVLKVNSQGLWFASEGELGFVQLIDEHGAELARGILTTKENWMSSEPVEFSTTLTFTTTAKKGTLIVHNNPGEGDGEEAGEEKRIKIQVSF